MDGAAAGGAPTPDVAVDTAAAAVAAVVVGSGAAPAMVGVEAALAAAYCWP